MRILNITAQKPDSTGSGVYLAATVRAFAQAGHHVGIIAGIDASDNPVLPDGTWFRPVQYGTPALPFPVCGMSNEMPYHSTRYCDMTPAMVEQFEHAFGLALDQALEEFKPDLIICHHLYLLCAIVRERSAGIPLAAVCHSTDLRQMGQHNLEKQRIIAAMRKLDAALALHDEQAAAIVETYGIDPERVTVVGTGFDRAIFGMAKRVSAADAATPNSDASLAGAADVDAPTPVELIYAGKIWEKKGVVSLIRALDLLPYPADGLALRMAGGYSTREEYDAIRARAAQSRYPIEFLGKLTQPRLAQAYQRASVFVLPSFFEGLPLVVIEALACGCKVVMTDLPGIRPWIEANVDQAPIVYVEPPRMLRVDEPYAEDLPAFEQRLAVALEECIALPARSTDVSNLSWDALASRMLRAATAHTSTCER